MKMVVAQLGARMHYAVPRILSEAGMLERFYTDICAVKGWPPLLRVVPRTLRPNGLQRLLRRVPHGIPADCITAFTSFGWQYYRRLARSRSAVERFAVCRWAGSKFNELIIASGFGAATGVYGYNTASAELFAAARARGLRTILEQTSAPCQIEHQLMADAVARSPEWESDNVQYLASEGFAARQWEEWNTADLIVCGSEFVREGIAVCNGPADRVCVVPYGVNAGEQAIGETDRTKVCRQEIAPRLDRATVLNVLTVAGVRLQKGAPWVLETAKAMRGKAAFRWVGPLVLLPPAEARMREHVELTGKVPRGEVAKHYQWADVFLLPSICEGSATVTYEALAAGLPVVTTPNAGSVVRDGVDGFIVPACDHEAIAAHLRELAIRPELRQWMSNNARQRAREFTVAAYGDRLLKALALL